jgi:hypothetical protein
MQSWNAKYASKDWNYSVPSTFQRDWTRAQRLLRGGPSKAGEQDEEKQDGEETGES